MDIERLRHIVQYPGDLSDNDTQELRKMVDQYPYCQTYRVLLGLSASVNNDLDKGERLSIAALYSGNRKELFRRVEKGEWETPSAETFEPVGIDKDEKSTPKEDIREEEAISHPKEIAENSPREEPENEDPVTASQDGEDLDRSPLDDTIASEATLRLGEMEVERSLNRDEGESATREEQDNSSEEKAPETSEGKEEATEAYSGFSAWLLGKKTEQAANREENPEEKEEQTDKGPSERALIEKFIWDQPRINPSKASFFNPETAGKQSLHEDDSLVTETLASIYVKQGEYKKAKRAYEQLALKYPKKSSYFARLAGQAEKRKAEKKNR